MTVTAMIRAMARLWPLLLLLAMLVAGAVTGAIETRAHDRGSRLSVDGRTPSGLTSADLGGWRPTPHPPNASRTQRASRSRSLLSDVPAGAMRTGSTAATGSTRLSTSPSRSTRVTVTHRHPAPRQAAEAAGGASGGLPEVLLRIRSCESGPNGYATGGRAHDFNYRAVNRRSTASGAWQALDGTWGGWGGYRRALFAPPAVQDAFARDLYRRSGVRPWAASRSCWGGR